MNGRKLHGGIVRFQAEQRFVVAIGPVAESLLKPSKQFIGTGMCRRGLSMQQFAQVQIIGDLPLAGDLPGQPGDRAFVTQQPPPHHNETVALPERVPFQKPINEVR